MGEIKFFTDIIIVAGSILILGICIFVIYLLLRKWYSRRRTTSEPADEQASELKCMRPYEQGWDPASESSSEFWVMNGEQACQPVREPACESTMETAIELAMETANESALETANESAMANETACKGAPKKINKKAYKKALKRSFRMRFIKGRKRSSKRLFAQVFKVIREECRCK